MNIIFMGTPEFAVPSLAKLISSHHNISAVVTASDKPQGRGLKLSECAVKKEALKNNLKILQPADLMDRNFIEELKNLKPDLIIVVAFRILPKEIFTIPGFGSINLHASLLPKYRGAAPINWAIINGEKETGVTTFFLNEKVDTGNVIIAEKCEIDEDDDAGTLHDKLAVLGANAVMSTVNLIEMTGGNVPVYEQSESLYTKAPKIYREFCRINWDNSVRTLHNFVRGLSPYPAAFTCHSNKTFKIFKTSLKESSKLNNIKDSKPGTIKPVDGKIFAAGNDGYIEILEIQQEGKKRMPVQEFLHGYKISDGDFFGN
jgi:methionyl-tRNA formyltransferase